MKSPKKFTIISSAILVLLLTDCLFNVYQVNRYKNLRTNILSKQISDPNVIPPGTGSNNYDFSILKETESQEIIYSFFERYFSWDNGKDFDESRAELRKEFPELVDNPFVDLNQNYRDDLENDQKSSARISNTIYQNADSTQSTVFVQQHSNINGIDKTTNFIAHCSYSDDQLKIDSLHQVEEIETVKPLSP